MAEPQEVCPEHDLRIDQFGCWACGHAGPITDDVWLSWWLWSSDRYIETLSRVRTRGVPAPVV